MSDLADMEHTRQKSRGREEGLTTTNHQLASLPARFSDAVHSETFKQLLSSLSRMNR